jgi:hypothetical protein
MNRFQRIAVLCIAGLSGITGLSVAEDVVWGRHELGFVGARAQAMAGASIAATNDLSALHNNPAGLMKIRSVALGFSLDQAQRTLPPHMATSAGMVNYARFAMVAAALPISILDYPMRFAFARVEPTLSSLYIDSNDISSGIGVYDFALATQFSPHFSVGVTLSLWQGSMQLGEGIKRDYNGRNISIGAIFESGEGPDAEKLSYSVGLIARTPFTLDSEYETSNGGLIYSPTDDSPYPPNGHFGPWPPNRDYEIEMPWIFGIGYQSFINNHLSFVMDIEYHLNQDRDIVATQTFLVPATYLLATHNRNTWHARSGVEILQPLPSLELFVRGGVGTFQSLLATQKDEPVWGVRYGLGAGIRNEFISFDLSWSHLMYNNDDGTSNEPIPIDYLTEDPEYPDPEFSPPYIYPYPDQEYGERVLTEIKLTLSYNFNIGI